MLGGFLFVVRGACLLYFHLLALSLSFPELLSLVLVAHRREPYRQGRIAKPLPGSQTAEGEYGGRPTV